VLVRNVEEAAMSRHDLFHDSDQEIGSGTARVTRVPKPERTDQTDENEGRPKKIDLKALRDDRRERRQSSRPQAPKPKKTISEMMAERYSKMDYKQSRYAEDDTPWNDESNPDIWNWNE